MSHVLVLSHGRDQRMFVPCHCRLSNLFLTAGIEYFLTSKLQVLRTERLVSMMILKHGCAIPETDTDVVLCPAHRKMPIRTQSVHSRLLIWSSRFFISSSPFRMLLCKNTNCEDRLQLVDNIPYLFQHHRLSSLVVEKKSSDN